MHCPTCGTANSDVKATRPYKKLFTRRSRMCFNGHPFFTYEVTLGCLDKRQVEALQHGIDRRQRTAAMRKAAVTDTRSAEAIARDFGVSGQLIRLYRKEAAYRKTPNVEAKAPT